MEVESKTRNHRQFSLRTLIEAVFVTAVVLAILYQGLGPQRPAARYQMQVNTNDNFQSLVKITVLDTETGQCYHYDSPNASQGWKKLPPLP